ncbi:alpha/beta hydrolase [Piscinibacter sakaiensis]|uniref:alpha/beta fold hydrolase n=1 Tax=Piscinibacter sakaiensis TaxID=1547922 RepID=UPI0037282DBA
MKLELEGRAAWVYTGGRAFDASLPAVGAMDDHSVWALQSRWLAHHGHAVLAVDLPGHGRSAGPALASVEALADWVVALLDAVGARAPLLVGHSMGSLVALEAAARLGERARGLVMVGTAYPMKVSPALLDTARADPLRAIDLVNGYAHSTLAAKPSAPAPGFWLRGQARALNRRNLRGYAEAGHGNLFHHDFQVCDAYAHGLEAAATVRCPTRFVLGERDQMTPPSATAALAQALRADIVRLPAGHALMGEAPDGVLEVLGAMPLP